MRPTGKNADKLICVLQALLLAGFLPACGRASARDALSPDTSSAPVCVSSPLPTASDEDSVPAPAASPEAPATPGTDELILYFNELVLESEYLGASEPGLVRKWTRPVLYYALGDYTADDSQAILQTAELLNHIEGFPGLSPTSREDTADMLIRFCSDEEFFALAGGLTDNEDADGAGIIRFNSRDNEILKADIYIRQSTAADIRSGVITEEIVNCIGLGNDSLLRSDSLLSQHEDNNALSDIDLQIISLLYDPAICCGMNAKECEEVIRSLLS